MKEKLGKLIFKDSFIIFLYLFMIEVIIRFNLKIKFLSWDTLRISISSFIISIIISLFINLFRKRIKNILLTLISFLIMVYSWFQINLFFYLGFFMGVGNTQQGFKVTDYFREFLSLSKMTTYLFMLPFIILMIYYWYLNEKLIKKRLNQTAYFKFEMESKKSKFYPYLVYPLIILGLGLLYYFTLTAKFMQNEVQSVKNINLLVNPENANLAASQFGVMVFGLSDLSHHLFEYELSSEYNYVHEKEDYKSQTPNYQRKIDDYSWNELIQNETNKNLQQLNDYFINQEITPKNDYTGIFEGKNLIVILMESASDLVINEQLFPNIYKLYSEGITFKNNYTPRNSCSTGNNELTVMTSLFTINNSCTANVYKDNKYFHSIFNMFNNAGYMTGSYHNFVEFYYHRRQMHLNMGSQVHKNAVDLKIKWSVLYEEWPSDIDLIEKAVPEFIEEDKFMVFLTTVSTHQPFTVSSTHGDAYLDEVDHLPYKKTVKRYLSKAKVLDNSIGLLLEKLEEAGKLDDTVIALFSDHYPYGLDRDAINEALPYDVTINNEVDRTPLIIYNSKNKGEEVNKYTSIIDLLPTLLNLFNINYDPRLYLGNDVFSNYDDRVAFADGSWQDKYGFYNSAKGKFIPSHDYPNFYTIEDIAKINFEIGFEHKISSMAIRRDYFNYLEKGLAKYPIIEDSEKESEEINE